MIMKKAAALLLALTILFSTPTVTMATEHEGPSAGAIVFDVLLVRPLGLAAFGIGVGVFAAGLPFTLLTGSMEITAKKLIADPLAFTFTRPVGDIHY